MSRVSLIEQLYTPKKKTALEFNYDSLWAPPIRFFLSQQDINELYKIATSLKYNDDIEKKYELIDAIMRPRGFKRGNCGTNRVVYNFLEDTSFCMKIAIDCVGLKDSPREYKNQEFFKPFCCKIFEVDPTGVIACVERVNPISSLEEFTSISDDVFNMMVTKIIGKYVVDDLGTEKFMNYGIRYNSNGIAFGPVVLDYPYAYELDGAKLRCAKPIRIGDKEFACGGEIDYDAGLNNLVCCKCGGKYTARELAKNDSNILKFYADNDQARMRARIVRESDGTIVKDSGRSSKIYMTKEQYEEGIKLFEVENFEPRKVVKTHRNKYTPLKELRLQYYTDLQTKAYLEMQERTKEPFNPVIKPEPNYTPAKRASKKENSGEAPVVESVVETTPYLEFPSVRPAKRAEDIKPAVVVEEEKVEQPVVVEETKYDDEGVEPNTEETDEDDFNLSHEIAKIVREIAGLDPTVPHITASQSNETFTEEMEADVFPEINNTKITIGSEVDAEPDYSNYVPPEDNSDSYDSEYEEGNGYGYHKGNRKYKNGKNTKRRRQKFNTDDDMYDY